MLTEIRTPTQPTDRAAPSLRAANGMQVLRLGLGVVWALNLIYIFDPANQYWPSFGTAASSYASQTLGGGGFANFVASYPTVFAVVIAGITVYLAVAFLLGLTTRLACVVGFGFTFALFVTQWAEIATFPGGTDVGAPPLYLAMFVALYIGYQVPRLSVDRVLHQWYGRVVERHRPTANPSA